jgi:hypothetical protein
MALNAAVLRAPAATAGIEAAGTISRMYYTGVVSRMYSQLYSLLYSLL